LFSFLCFAALAHASRDIFCLHVARRWAHGAAFFFVVYLPSFAMVVGEADVCWEGEGEGEKPVWRWQKKRCVVWVGGVA